MQFIFKECIEEISLTTQQSFERVVMLRIIPKVAWKLTVKPSLAKEIT